MSPPLQHVLRLPLQHGKRAGRSIVGDRDQGETAQNGSHRIPELVAKRRQKLFAMTILLFEIGGLPRQLLLTGLEIASPAAQRLVEALNVLVLCPALDEISCLAGQHISQRPVAVGKCVRLAIVDRQDTQDASVAGLERDRLHTAIAGLLGDGPVGSVAGVFRHVLDLHDLTRPEGPAACGAVAAVDLGEPFEKL